MQAGCFVFLSYYSDFECPEDSVIATEESPQQMQSTRSNSKRVRKFSLPDESIIKDEISSSFYSISPVANKKKGARQRGEYHRGPLLFQKSELYIYHS